MIEIIRTGKLPLLQETEKKFPKELGTLLRIPGLGPKRVLAPRDRLAVRDLCDLKKVMKTGKLRELPGFGARMEEKILEEIERAQIVHRRTKLADSSSCHDVTT